MLSNVKTAVKWEGWSIHKLGKDPESLRVTPNLTGLLYIVNFTDEGITAPGLVHFDPLINPRSDRAGGHLPGTAAEGSPRELTTVSPYCQQHIAAVAYEGVKVADLTASAAGKAVAVLDVAVVGKVAGAAAEGAGEGGIAGFGADHFSESGGGLEPPYPSILQH